ncbi:MAG: Uma2 family endonuclease [Deltaproteobacteria bacterium]|nr:Uma2 family endonuclease [Deltaproteobacteria bacterium]
MTAEVVDGELVVMPRPRRQHARASSRLGHRLGPFDDPQGDDPGGWVILDEPELHLGPLPDIVDPDLAGWRRERIPDDFLAPEAPAHIALSPDWVCEVLSERTEAVDRGRKMRIWRREKVGHVWLLSPELKTLEVYALAAQETPAGVRDRYSLVDTYEGNARVRAEPFEALELDLAALWSL